MVETIGNYEIEYTSTPFKLMRYHLRATRGLMKIKIHYWNAGSYEVYADGVKVEPTAWDKEAGSQAELSMYKGCGENRFVGVVNYLEFAITPYCLIEIKPLDSIVTNVRMDWTMDEFYSNGGVTSFVDRVSAALGIHASQFKVVAVYTGSVVVDYEITTADSSDSSSSTSELAKIQSNLNTLATSSDAGSVFGAPVLSASVGDSSVVEDPSYNPGAAVEIVTSDVSEYSMTRPDAIILEDEPNQPKDEHHVLTLSDEGLSIQMTDEARASLIAILVAIVLLLVCCFSCGAFVICLYSLSKASK